MIELAVKTWKCNLPQALRRLSDAGVALPADATTDARIADYQKWALGLQVRAHALRATAAEDLALGRVNPGYILQQIGQPKDQDKPYWRHRMGRFMGGCTRHGALGITKPETTAHGRVDDTVKFQGKRWGPLVAIPFNDLPQRIAGYLFIGRQARPGADYEFILLDEPDLKGEKKSDIGVCMYEVMDSTIAYRETFRDTVFVFNDPIQALKMQARHMRDSELPLPIVSTYSAKMLRNGTKSNQRTWELVTHSVWNTRPDKTFVFWSATVSPDVFINAARADGRVYICKSLLITSRNPGHVWLQIIQQQARPWAEVLEKELLAMDEATACDFIANLDFAPETLAQFQHGVCDKLRILMESNRPQVRTLRVAVIRATRVVETPAGWTLEKTGEVISNVILRVDKIVSHTDSDDPYYVGRIIVGDKEAEFATPYSSMAELKVGKWLHNQTVKLLGVAPVIKHAWVPHIMDISRQFHAPQVVREDGKFGWKTREMCFSLPRFAVHVGGNVVTEPAHVVDTYAPGQHLLPPELPPVDIAKLARECLQNELYWAITACLGANIIAPALGHPLANVGITGKIGTGLGYTVARRAGCIAIDPTSTTTCPNKVVEQLETATHTHAWPVILRTNRLRYGLARWLNSTSTCNVITVLPDATPMLAPVISPWRLINIPLDLDLSAEAQLYGDLVIPLWLQRLCRQKLELSSTSRIFVLQVLDDMATMMAELGGNAEDVRASGRHIDDSTAPEAAGAKLVELLYRAIEDGVLQFEHDVSPNGNKLPKVVQVENDKYSGIFLSGSGLARVLDSYDLFTPSPGAITDALVAANGLDCRCSYNGDSGWLIIERYWHTQIARCRARHKRLTVIGG
jgi:hypothetical protein